MELYEKITKETDDNALYTLLGSVLYTNLSHLYNRLRKDEVHRLFYKDYLSGEKVDKWLVKELLENEDHIDFTKPISEKDYEQLLFDINEGYGNGDLITHHVAKMTDAYIGDGIIKY